MFFWALLLSLAAISAYSAKLPVPENLPPFFDLPECKVRFIGYWYFTAKDEGVATNHSSRTLKVASFQGVPYAVAPLGRRRFRSPELLDCPSAAGPLNESGYDWGHHLPEKSDDWQFYNATYHRHICVQKLFVMLGHEDCLFLTIFVPAVFMEQLFNLSDTKPYFAPILFFIHGGDFTFGGGQSMPFGFFAANAGGAHKSSGLESRRRAAIVVCVNYRLGTLGFLAIDAMRKEVDRSPVVGNWGIQDQICALKYVQKHAHRFMGDRRRVTLMGQSSGGTSIFALKFSPLTHGLFHAGIAVSGSTNQSMDWVLKAQQDQPIVGTLGCDSTAHLRTNASAQMECLRSLSADAVIQAHPHSWALDSIMSVRNLPLTKNPRGRAYPGMLFVDGVVLTEPDLLSACAQSTDNRTLIWGNMGQSVDVLPPTIDVSKYNAAEYRAFLEKQVFQNAVNATASAEIFLAAYNSSPAHKTPPNPQFMDDCFVTDFALSCPMTWMAQHYASGQSKAKMFLYHDEFAPQRPQPGNTTVRKWAYHMYDLLAVMGHYFWWYADPAPIDLAFGSLLRSQWYVVMNHTLDDMPDEIVVRNPIEPRRKRLLRWRAVARNSNASAGPRGFVYARTTRYPWLGLGERTGYRMRHCETVRALNLSGMGYWWSN